MNKANIEQHIHEFSEKIVREFQPEKVILFGSWAWGNPSLESDVDLLVVKETEDPHALTHRIERSLSPRTVPLDVIVQTPGELKRKIQQDRNLFLEDIITNGRVLYAHDQIRS